MHSAAYSKFAFKLSLLPFLPRASRVRKHADELLPSACQGMQLVRPSGVVISHTGGTYAGKSKHVLEEVE